MFKRCLIYAIAIVANVFGCWTRAEVTSSVIIVRPKGWESSTDEWVKYREQDYQVIRVDSVSSSNDLKFAILQAVNKSKIPVKAVLLCGDIGVSGDPKINKGKFTPITPTFETETKVKLGPLTTPTLATDLFYGDLDGDECPELAVGRLPAKDAQELARMLRRSIDYEQSQSYGPWRDRIHATAGVGGFGVLADTAIESVARRLLSEGIPDRFQLNMTYASLTSPYCPDPFSLTRSFIGKINEGGLFWVYIGHGGVDRLDDFMVGKDAIPICLNEDVSQFDVQDGPPIALMLACFTGAFDARVDCFAETLLARKDGPIAVIAGSRVTMPYGLSQLSTEMMDGCFRDQISTLGGIVLNAKRNIWKQSETGVTKAQAKAENLRFLPIELKRNEPEALADVLRHGSASASGSITAGDRLRAKQQAMIEQMATALSPEGHDLTEERREHVRLMNLLGDPLLRIKHPVSLPIACEVEPQAGKQLVVTGKSLRPGKLRVELTLSRDRLPNGIRSVGNYQGTEDQRKSMQDNYSRASDLVLSKFEKEIAPGEFSIELSVPSDCRGRCVVRAFVYSSDAWASGSQRVNVLRTK